MIDGKRWERLHKRVWDLLPWYVNGTLADGERRTVELHLAECLRCREEIATCQRLGETLQQTREIAPMVHPARLARLMERIEAEERDSRRGWRDALLAPGRGLASLARSTPPLARGALVVQLLLLVAVTGLFVRSPRQPAAPAPAPEYQTLSESAPAPAAVARLRLVFAERTTEQEVRDLLLGIRGQIVSGPSALGVYTVEVPAGPDPLEKVLAHLRAQPRVSLAEPAVGQL
ncbi:MAG TPA: zf-HC2 domain-containing protein [Thermoanaerobaculia bacterium]|nr:zf-HC2 domain-containing protein [Thermoanaerobaculia bacterium]